VNFSFCPSVLFLFAGEIINRFPQYDWRKIAITLIYRVEFPKIPKNYPRKGKNILTGWGFLGAWISFDCAQFCAHQQSRPIAMRRDAIR
jgi:hypothetical protein